MENKEITAREATYHGNNQLMVGFLAIVSVLAFFELLIEDSLPQKLDDGIIFLLVVSAVVWYFGQNHRYQRSFVPLAIIMACSIVKLGAVALVEASFSQYDLGDFATLFALVVSLIISTIVYVRSPEGAAARESEVLTVREAINRANNLLMVGLLAVTFLPLFPPAIEKDNLASGIDDTTIMVMALAGFIWYFTRRNRFQHSLAPLAFVVISFVAQAGSLFLEIPAPSHEGMNDVPVFAAFMMGVILSTIIYWRSREKAVLPETAPISQVDSQNQ